MFLNELFPFSPESLFSTPFFVNLFQSYTRPPSLCPCLFPQNKLGAKKIRANIKNTYICIKIESIMAKATSKSINWIEGLIIKTFGLTKILEGFPLLDAWLTVSGDLPAEETQRLEKWRLKLLKNVGTWNEETLKMKFIANIIELVDYDTDEFEGTFDAEMKGVVQGQKLSVVADYALAKATLDYMETPYFYFHEYKPRKRAKDPIAQLLLAMLIAQSQTKRKYPLYGCAVFGELWFFMVLDDKTYSVSTGIVSTNKDDLQRILLILRKFKHILATELNVS
jgi:hypothetical protein